VTFFANFGIFLFSTPIAASRGAGSSLFADLKEGLRFTASIQWLWVTIAAYAVINLFSLAPLIVGLPLLVQNVIGGGAKVFGLIGAAAGVGELIATFAISQLRIKYLGVFLYSASALE